MLDRLRTLGIFSDASGEDGAVEAPGKLFTALRLFTAELLLATGTNLTLHYLRNRSISAPSPGSDAGYGSGPQHDDGGPRWSTGFTWLPLLLGFLASTAQARYALQPSDETETATRVLNGMALGLGITGAVESAAGAVRGDDAFSVAPILFGYAGLLGFLLDRQERIVAEAESDLERRARIVERFVPRRKTKIDRIVVHV
jgi:hypothetical protein